MDGNLVWSKDLGQMRTRHQFGEGSSPALSGDTLVINWDLYYALDGPPGGIFDCFNQGATWIPLQLNIQGACGAGSGQHCVAGPCTLSYVWKVPAGLEAPEARIRVTLDSGTNQHDVSNEPFSFTAIDVTPAPGPASPPRRPGRPPGAPSPCGRRSSASATPAS